jgi:hypothetical protein
MSRAVTLTISYDPAGGFKVSGPVKDPLMCYGLLEMAKQEIARANAQGREESRIQAAPASLNPARLKVR